MLQNIKIRKAMTVAVLGVVTVMALVASGCATTGDAKPQSLTGDSGSKSYSDQVSENRARAKGESPPPAHRVPGSGR